MVASRSTTSAAIQPLIGTHAVRSVSYEVTAMNRFWQSFFYGLIVTLSIMGPTFGFGVLYTIATGGDAAAYAVDCIKLSFVCMIFSTWGLYELSAALERANRPRSEDRDRENPNGKRDDKNQHQPGDNNSDKNPK